MTKRRRTSDRLRELADSFHADGQKERADELHAEARVEEARRRSFEGHRVPDLVAALEEIAEPAHLPDGGDATEYWHHIASKRREIALKVLGREV